MMDALPANATTAEMAAWLRVSERTLKRWRAQRPPVGPPFVRVDATVRYPLEAALAWLLDSPAEMAKHRGTAAEPSHHRNAPVMGENRSSQMAGASR